jgi:4a-hydroxytetrahydrobiopterin dehydratase
MRILTEGEANNELGSISGWTLSGDTITKKYEFGDFVHALAFVNMVGLLAERANHHPDIDIRWNKVFIALSTHSAGGLTEKDFALARQIENL